MKLVSTYIVLRNGRFRRNFKVNTKLKFLKLPENDNDRLLGRNDEEEMKKHLQKFGEKKEEIRELK